MNGNLRLFIAFELPDDLRTAIAEYMQPLRNLPGRVSWVKPASIHLTLKFLGDAPQRRVDEITAGLRDIAPATPTIFAAIAGAGVFPNARHPRVVWIGIEEKSGALQKLATAIDGRMHTLGFEKEPHLYIPHLTIGRVREGAIDKILQNLQARPFAPRPVQFHEITLMQSELHPGGSVYTPLCKIKLGTS